MKKHLTILALTMLLNVSSTFAQSGMTGPLTWELNDGTLTISGEGEMPDYEWDIWAPWYDYRKSIVTVIIENGVTKIGNDAFRVCEKLTSITIPNSVTTIGYYAFYLCTALESITLPNSITAIKYGDFAACTALKSIAIPNSVTAIEVDAFKNCTALKYVTIPNSVTDISYGAFAGCTALTSITNLNPVPVEITFEVFEDVNQSACTLKVPTDAISAYQTADVWKEFHIEDVNMGIAPPSPPEGGGVRMYPNPTSGVFAICDLRFATCDNRMSDIGQSEIVIFDVMGRNVLTVAPVETGRAPSLQSQITPPPAPSKGGEFRKSEIGQSPIEINISHLPQGVYGVSVLSEGRVVGNGKVVKM
ncbi:MAG: leucine-rich repeat protein [Bacteroidales bacterium]|nr:leucine-rich repeat protein [Bacteroidales bacterium]